MPLAPPKPSQIVIAENLRHLLDHRALGVPAAAKLLGVKPFQVRRLLTGEHAMTIRTLDLLARKFGFEPYQLLIPGLNPGNPQILRALSPSEERLYQALDEARRNRR